jgi:beta-glucuronidase
VVPGLDAGSHEVVVEVDNSFGRHSALHRENDYMTYGGITRPVEVQYVPEVYIDKIFATPVKNGGSWSLDVRVRLKNWSRKALKRTVVVEIAGRAIELGTFNVNGSACRDVRGAVKSLDVKEWSPKSPNLYELEVAPFRQGRACRRYD